MDRRERREKRREALEWKRVRAVAERACRVVVDFHEHAVDAARDASSCERLDEFGLPAG
jgi:hypothetical protein